MVVSLVMIRISVCNMLIQRVTHDFSPTNPSCLQQPTVHWQFIAAAGRYCMARLAPTLRPTLMRAIPLALPTVSAFLLLRRAAKMRTQMRYPSHGNKDVFTCMQQQQQQQHQNQHQHHHHHHHDFLSLKSSLAVPLSSRHRLKPAWHLCPFVLLRSLQTLPAR